MSAKREVMTPITINFVWNDTDESVEGLTHTWSYETYVNINSNRWYTTVRNRAVKAFKAEGLRFELVWDIYIGEAEGDE